MSKLKFSIVEQGYSTAEVEKYIEMLQAEYSNAVEWSNEIEKKLEDVKSQAAYEDELSALKAENEKLLSDCRLLASKLREMNETNDKVCGEKAEEIINAANEKSETILSEALKNRNAIIEGAQDELAQLNRQIDALKNEKAALEKETVRLGKVKDEIFGRLEQAVALLDF